MILVVGGAGYIGSHIVKELVNQDRKVMVLDNLSTGNRKAVDEKAIFVEGDLSDRSVLRDIFGQYDIQAVMHFAANSLVGESVIDPYKYYENNVGKTIVLLEEMKLANVNNFVFSSTAATYGIPDTDILKEDNVTAPINPYGRSKLMVENILEDAFQAYGLNYVTMRYFNAAGAYENAEIGEAHDPETHLIPIILGHLLGERETISVFGTDYETKDGTCVRDYIHVSDLASAHILAVDALINKQVDHRVYNLGNGEGYTVKEIILTCEEVTGVKAKVVEGERRAGDPATLVASSAKISRELGWSPKYDLQQIISSAWNWHRNRSY
ncbi:UDP-glucose 4-epimerase GalE [Cytobacillus purgationiresistens]|uniref:UDP-glucose 4-epimerase n=1 Tax=Cytobacillus purgationiresistens TaxID=863449 RepID=A0ABU0AEF1_9BACI|nr:UDP-glucose 4-epimerase GalE [Cytobacillus purgationiresistens]MDQ0269121.1 UDP-glucose 4-epimerase [Cytobacillus purgationiresistens]